MATADREALAYDRAVELVERATAYEAPLRRRAEGVTWMVWGLVTAGLMFSGALVDAVYGADPAVAWWLNWLWVPWLLGALLGTKAVWSIANVTVPRLGPGRRRIALSVAGVVLIMGLGWGLASLLIPAAAESAYIFIALGSTWLALGAANPHRATPLGQRVMLGIGAALVLAGLAWTPYALTLPEQGWRQATVVVGLLGGGLPFLAGAWQALRG